MSEASFLCELCDKGFGAKKNLMKHLRRSHKAQDQANLLMVRKTQCSIQGCLFLCRRMQELRKHLKIKHNMHLYFDFLQFSCEKEFKKWKDEEELRSVACFVSFRQKHPLKGGGYKRILFCHRSGHYLPKGEGKYRLKAIGSLKIGRACPASIEVINQPGGLLKVTYCKTHAGHTQDIERMHLTKEERLQLSETIGKGFSLDAILKSVKESNIALIEDGTTGRETQRRIHSLSRKDLHNVIKSFHLKENNKRMIPKKSKASLKDLTKSTPKPDRSTTSNMAERVPPCDFIAISNTPTSPSEKNGSRVLIISPEGIYRSRPLVEPALENYLRQPASPVPVSSKESHQPIHTALIPRQRSHIVHQDLFKDDDSPSVLNNHSNSERVQSDIICCTRSQAIPSNYRPAADTIFSHVNYPPTGYQLVTDSMPLPPYTSATDPFEKQVAFPRIPITTTQNESHETGSDVPAESLKEVGPAQHLRELIGQIQSNIYKVEIMTTRQYAVLKARLGGALNLLNKATVRGRSSRRRLRKLGHGDVEWNGNNTSYAFGSSAQSDTYFPGYS